MKIVKIIAWIALIALVAIQFFPVDYNQSETIPQTDFMLVNNVPVTVEKSLQVSCYDCHSNNTQYPWYSQITPVNFWMAEHIDNGKKHLNLSKWNSYSVKKKDHKIEELIEVVEDKSMPLESYTWVHAEAKLSEAEIESVKEWAQNLRIKYSLMAKPE